MYFEAAGGIRLERNEFESEMNADSACAQVLSATKHSCVEVGPRGALSSQVLRVQLRAPT